MMGVCVLCAKSRKSAKSTETLQSYRYNPKKCGKPYKFYLLNWDWKA